MDGSPLAAFAEHPEGVVLGDVLEGEVGDFGESQACVEHDRDECIVASGGAVVTGAAL